VSAAELRAALVAGLRRDGYLNVPAVERAFLRVPRERFLPGLELAEVYRDAAILIKEEGGIGVASSSQPAIMAIMLEMLDTHPGQRVLEVGAGSGYNAAILRELVGESGAVASVEIDAEVATWARERLGAAGYPDVAVRHADGAEGWPGGAPWDRVIVTVGAGDIASAWVSSSRGGICLRRAGGGAGVVAFERLGERLSRAGIEPAAYPRARGLADAASGRVRAGINALTTEGRARRLSVLLRATPLVETWPGTLRDGQYILSILAGIPVVSLWSTNTEASFFGPAFGRIDPDGGSLALVTQDGEACRLLVFGDDSAARLLRDDRERWLRSGAPGLRELRLAAWPRGRAPEPGPGRLAFDLPGWTLVADWPTDQAR